MSYRQLITNSRCCPGELGRSIPHSWPGQKSHPVLWEGDCHSTRIGDRRAEGTGLNNLGSAFQTQEKYTEALACYLLAREIRIQIKDPNLKTTESNLKNLKEILGKKKFEKLMAKTALEAQEIVRKMLEGASDW